MGKIGNILKDKWHERDVMYTKHSLMYYTKNKWHEK